MTSASSFVDIAFHKGSENLTSGTDLGLAKTGSKPIYNLYADRGKL
jgi:hypothetical protein